jgi:ABC-type transport system substrate-binding protein
VGTGSFKRAFSAAFKSEFGDFDPARAQALLDMHGYIDQDGDGWRDLPTGAPLLLPFATQAQQRDRRICEIIAKNMKTLGLRTQFNVAQWPENLKAARNGKLALWSVASSADAPDGAERAALFTQAQQLALAYMPYKFLLNRKSIDMTQPQLIGYRRPVFWLDWWQFVDVVRE